MFSKLQLSELKYKDTMNKPTIAQTATTTLIAALLTSAHADPMPSTIGIHLASAHSNNAHPWNNRNPGLYARWGALGSGGAVVGSFYNSERRQNVYAGYVFESDSGMFAITAGAATGYKGGAVVPILAASMRVATPLIAQNSAIRLHLAPKPPKQANGAAALHLSVEFGL